MKRTFLMIFFTLLCAGSVSAQYARTVMADSDWVLQHRDAIIDTNNIAVRAGDITGDTNSTTVVGIHGSSLPVPGGGDAGKGYEWTGAAWILAAGGGGASTSAWGMITGDITNQVDLWTQLTNRYTKAESDALNVALSNALTVAYTVADTALSNALTIAYQAADVTLSNQLTSAYQAADTVVSNWTVATFVPLSQKAAANGVATLDAFGKIPDGQIPAIAITETVTYATTNAMQADVTNRTPGDVGIVTDAGGGGTNQNSYIVNNSTNWAELLRPLDTVLSINGEVGNVLLDTSDVPEGTNLYYTESRTVTDGFAKVAQYVAADTALSNSLVAQIDLKVDITGGVATNLAMNGSTEVVDATATTQVVNWQTMTNYVAATEEGLTTNDSPTMADGTTWIFEKAQIRQEVAESITTDTQLTLDDGGKVFIVDTSAGDVTMSLPTNATALTVGTDFRFVNLSTNLLIIDAAAADSIDDSDPGAQIYSGVSATNDWPWSSITIKQADSNWWHALGARGDWTTTGTNASPIPSDSLPVSYGEMTDYVVWGNVGGTLSNQTDLNTELTNRYTKAQVDALDVALSNALTIAYMAADVTLSNQLTVAYTAADTALSNALVSAYVAADTVVSNALQTQIDLKVDITGGVATNLAMNGSTESVGASSGDEVVNWTTLTNQIAVQVPGIITNNSFNMADGTTWVFAKMRYLQEDYYYVTNDLQLTIDDGGKAYIVEGTAEITISLPTGSSALSVGMDFQFVNLTTNLLTIDAPDGFSIDDSDPGAQIYSGINGTNDWPWSSVKLKQADSNWWHVLHARGDWTTTGTNAASIPPPVRGIGGLYSMTAGVTNQTVSYGATYTIDMWPVVTPTADATFQVTPEIVSYSRSNFVFRLRGASSFVTNGWDVIWNANPSP